MVDNSKECRRHAARRAELAMAARTPQMKATFLALSKNWETFAIELEDAFGRVEETKIIRSDTAFSEMTFVILITSPLADRGTSRRIDRSISRLLPRAVGRDLVGSVE